MLARLHNQPFVLVATTRPGLDDRWTPAPGKHNELALHLDPLDRDSTAELVRALFCGDADDETVEFLLERSGGNPFFVEELVAFVQETRDSDRLHELPATLHGLRRGPARRARAGRALAARGLRGRRRERPDRRGRSPSPAAPTRAGCSTASPNATSSRIDHDEFHFKSELIREIAYGTLTKAERARRHARRRAGARGARRAGHRPGRASPRHRGRARRRARRGRRRSRRRPRAGDRRARCAPPSATSRSSRGSPAERHHDRALALLGTENTDRAPHRAARPRPGPRAPARPRRRARRRARPRSSDARDADDRAGEAVALTLLGEGEAATGAYDVAEETFGEALDSCGASSTTSRAPPTCCAGSA